MKTCTKYDKLKYWIVDIIGKIQKPCAESAFPGARWLNGKLGCLNGRIFYSIDPEEWRIPTCEDTVGCEWIGCIHRKANPSCYADNCCIRDRKPCAEHECKSHRHK